MGWRPDRTPITWLIWQMAEVVVLLAVLSILVPSSWSGGARASVVIGVLVVAWVLNYRWIQHARARDESSRPAD